MKSRLKSGIATLFLVLSLTTLSCKKNENSPDPAIVSLLIGSPNKVWQLYDYSFNNISRPLSDCYKNNDHLAFYADGSYMQSRYICGNDLLKIINPGSGKWKLDADKVTLHINTGIFSNFNIINLTATLLTLGNGGYTYYYKSVDSQPFLSASQQLSGSGTKTWKFSRRMELLPVRQSLSLTAEQMATRLTFMANGSLIKSYTDPAYGKSITSSWMIDQDQYSIITNPPGAISSTVYSSVLMLELTPTSLGFYENDYNTLSYNEVFLIPE